MAARTAIRILTMKPPEPFGDDKLRKTLLEWKADASLPPRFREEVWRRITATEGESTPAAVWQTVAQAVQAIFARPAFVAACVLVFVAAGFSAGWVQGRERTARINSSLGARYVQSVDPYQTPRR